MQESTELQQAVEVKHEQEVQVDQTDAPKGYIKNTKYKSKSESRKFRNKKLSKILRPKNAIIVLHELAPDVTFNLEQPLGNQFKAAALVDGKEHVGFGKSKNLAKTAAAEAAIKYIYKTKRLSECASSENVEDGQALPWQQIASFAMYKLLSSWGEEVDKKGSEIGLQPQPAKKMPEKPELIHPLMLVNQMLPNAQYTEMENEGNTQNFIYKIQMTVDGQTFYGLGSSKKTAKKMAAFQACHKILNVQYPPEIYIPQESQQQQVVSNIP